MVALFVLVDFLGLPKPRGDAVALDSLGGTSGENEGTSGEDEDKSQSKLKKTQRLSPAFGLVKHVDALKKHCPSLDPGAKSDTSQSVPLKLYSAGEVAECMFLVLRGAYWAFHQIPNPISVCPYTTDTCFSFSQSQARRARTPRRGPKATVRLVRHPRRRR